MTDSEQARNGRSASDGNPDAAQGHENASPPNEQEIARRHNEETARNRERFIYRPIKTVADWLDSHNGLVTAAATVAIAWLTWSLSSDSSRQAETANGILSATRAQQTAMEGQLAEMRRQRELTVAQLSASLRREPPEYRPIDSVGNYVIPGAPTAVGWAFNPIWRDVGPTKAKNFVSRSTHTEAPVVSDQTGRTTWKCPTVAQPDLSEQAGSIVDKDGVITEIAINVSNTIVARALEPNPDLVLYLIGSIQYNDIFPDTSAHHFDWCVAAVPSNLVTGGFNFHRMYEREYEK
jgi:hypothetical protein